MHHTLQHGKTRWSHYQIAYHFVWIPKYRRRILTGEVQKAAKEAIAICCLTHGFELLALETDIDHVHCFVSAPPKDSPSKVVGLLKGYSSRIVRQRFPSLAKRTGKEQLWAGSYYVGIAGGAVSTETIRRYICDCQGK